MIPFFIVVLFLTFHSNLLVIAIAKSGAHRRVPSLTRIQFTFFTSTNLTFINHLYISYRLRFQLNNYSLERINGGLSNPPPIPQLPPKKNGGANGDASAASTMGLLAFPSNNTSLHIIQLSSKYSKDLKTSIQSLISKFERPETNVTSNINNYAIKTIAWNNPFSPRESNTNSGLSNNSVFTIS
jgi:hypothetical protein